MLAGVLTFAGLLVDFCSFTSFLCFLTLHLILLRRAVEIFVNSDDSQTGVDMDHVKQAIQEMTKSSLIPQIQRCSFQQLLFLLSCVKRSRATGIKELTFCDIVDDHYAFCFKYLSEKYTPSVSTLHEIANFLSGFNLLIAERSKAGEPGQKIQMRVHEDDIFQAIKSISHPKLMPILKQLDPSA
jgi:Cdc6-like AAA superfamily ATPase